MAVHSVKLILYILYISVQWKRKYLEKLIPTFIGKQLLKWFTPHHCFFTGNSVDVIKYFIMDCVESLLGNLLWQILYFYYFYSCFTCLPFWLLHNEVVLILAILNHWSHYFQNSPDQVMPQNIIKKCFINVWIILFIYLFKKLLMC